MDIRRYFFSPNAKNKPAASQRKESGGAPATPVRTQRRHKQSIELVHDETEVKPRKKMARKRIAVIESDDDDEEDPIPPKKPATARAKLRLAIEDSDDEEPFPIKKLPKKEVVDRSPVKKQPVPLATVTKRPSQQKVAKVVTASAFFGTTPVKRDIQTNDVTSQKNGNGGAHGYEIHDDDDFVATLKALDDDQSMTTMAASNKHNNNEKVKISSPIKEEHSVNVKKSIEVDRVISTQTKKLDCLDTSVAELPADKRRRSYLSYMQYQNREGPSAPGSKVVPEGAEGCFHGLHFVVTGVLDSLERDQAADLIKKYGGKLQASVCKSSDYMVVGRDAGPSKLEKADKMGTKQISEDEFLDLIRTLPRNKLGTGSHSTNKKSASTSHHDKTSTVVPAATKSTKLVRHPAKSVETEPDGSMIATTSKQSPQSSQASDADFNLMWVDKYKPKTTKQIIGQNGDKSNVKKLVHWLSNWHRNRSDKPKKKPSAGTWNSTDGSGFKAVLLSGSPGVGKTTSAQLVCKELGFTYVELNASDTRSKRNLQEVVAELLRNKSLTHYVLGKPDDAGKHCLLMDEVDGMAGNEDRGGIQELIQLIKGSKIPIICLCNDRNHQKIRSLANYCFDLRFQKPRVEQLKGALMSVCFKEGLEISSDALHEIIVGANQDVRQVLHHLSVWSVKNKKLSVEQALLEATKSKKDLKMGPFDVLRMVFSESENKTMSIHDKSDLFFHDYSLSPLFVFENYPCVVPHATPNDAVNRLRLLSDAADSICKGDLVEKLVRSQGHWGLLPVEAIFASVVPGHVLAGHVGQKINFPSWLGRNSSRSKTDRLLQELHMHTRLRTSGNKTDLNADYVQSIREAIVHPLVADGQDGIRDAVAVMNEYNLLREDLDSIMDISLWPNFPNPFAKLSSQVKASFTRAYNKMAHTNPYAAAIGVNNKARKTATMVADDGLAGDDFDENDIVDENGGDEDDDDEDVTVRVTIKTSSSERKSKVTKAGSSKKGSSKGGTRKKGKS